MRIIFVGIHNKPGMQPLDSRTKTGLAIDKVIRHFPHRVCVKSNLIDAEQLPAAEEGIKTYAIDWLGRLGPIAAEDIVVTLGMTVAMHLPRCMATKNIVNVVHPGRVMGKPEMDHYIRTTVNKIKALL